MVLGIDIGSCYTKGLLFEDGIKKTALVKTAFKPIEAIEAIKSELHNYTKIIATGYGRELLSDADKVITEITAFAKGGWYINKDVRTIIDIGGQDSKVLKIKDGKIENFIMNDRCAAGTGNFIEKIAQALNLELEEFGKLAQRSETPEMIDSLCVVMAESEILSLISERKKIEDIVAGVCNSLITRLLSIGAQVKIEEPILFCGGGALNPGLVKALKRRYRDVILPPQPQFIGALGAAVAGLTLQHF